MSIVQKLTGQKLKDNSIYFSRRGAHTQTNTKEPDVGLNSGLYEYTRIKFMLQSRLPVQ